MKRVVFLTNALVTGGAEKVFMLQANGLAKRGWDVHMVLLFKHGELADALALPSDRVHAVGVRSVFDVAGFFRTLRLVRRIRPDTLYTTLNEANLIGRLLALCMPRVRLVTREANMADVKPRLYRWGDILFGLRSSVVMAVSRAVGDSVASYAPHLSKRIRVLHNPVSLPTDFSRTPGNTVRLLNVGSLTPKKDQAVLVRALPFLPENVTLTLVGDGVERERLETLARESGVAERVTLAGAVSPERVGEFYKSHDVFVLSSTREGCPNVVLEALSYRLPVVAFDIAGMSEFISPEWGVLVGKRDPKDLADALVPLIASQETRARLGETGFAQVSKNHTVKIHVSSLENLISRT